MCENTYGGYGVSARERKSSEMKKECKKTVFSVSGASSVNMVRQMGTLASTNTYTFAWEMAEILQRVSFGKFNCCSRWMRVHQESAENSVKSAPKSIKIKIFIFSCDFYLAQNSSASCVCFFHGCFGQWEKTDPFATDKRSFCFVSIQLSFKHCIIRCDETSQKLIAAATTSFAKIQANRKTNATDAEYMCHRR